MTSIVTETNLLTFKSQVALNPNDIIAIRDTVDNNISVGVNTIGDFDSYYISTSRPTFGSTFFGGTLTSNISSNQLGETQTNSLTITNANVTLSEYPSAPLNIVGATAYIEENYTPNIEISGATFTYRVTRPFSLNDAVFTGPVGKVSQNKIVKLEIIPTVGMDYSYKQVYWATTGIPYTGGKVVLPAVDVTLLFDVANMDINNGINLPVFLESDDYMDAPAGVCVISNKFYFGSKLLPLYCREYGQLNLVTSPGEYGTDLVSAYYSGFGWIQRFKEQNSQFNTVEKWTIDQGTVPNPIEYYDYYGTMLCRIRKDNSSYRVRLTYSDGTQITTKDISFLGGTKITTESQVVGYNFCSKTPSVYTGAVSDPWNRNLVASFNLYRAASAAPYKKIVVDGEINVDNDHTFTLFTNCHIAQNYVINTSSFESGSLSALNTQYLSVRNVTINVLSTLQSGVSRQYGINLNNLQLDGSYNYVCTDANNSSANITVLSQSALLNAFNSSTQEPFPVAFTNSTTYTLGTILRAQIVSNSANLNNITQCIANVDDIIATVQRGLSRSYLQPLPYGTGIYWFSYPGVPYNELRAEFIIGTEIANLLTNRTSDPSFMGLIGYYAPIQSAITQFFYKYLNSINPLNGTISDTTHLTNLTSSLRRLSETFTIFKNLLTNQTTRLQITSTVGRTPANSSFTLTTSTDILIPNSSYSSEYTFGTTPQSIQKLTDLSTSVGSLTFLDYVKTYSNLPVNSYSNTLNLISAEYNSLFVWFDLSNTTKSGYRVGIDGIFAGATLTYKYNYSYDIGPGITYNAYITDTTTYSSTVSFNLRPSVAYQASITVSNPLTHGITVTEVKSLTNYLVSNINGDQTISIPSSPIVGNTIYPGITFTYPINGGYVTLDGSWQGSGNILPTSQPLLNGRQTYGFNFANTAGAFAPILSLPQTFNITSFLNSRISNGQLTIDPIDYNGDGGINSLGISAADLQYCLPVLETLTYTIDYQVGSTFYYTQSSVTGNAMSSGLILSPNLADTNQKIFKMMDREKRFTVSDIPSGTTMLYFTTISANPTGYTFTETPFQINNLSRNDPISYVIYNGYSPLTSINTGDSISRLIDINDPYLDRTDILFNSISSGPGDSPINTTDEDVLSTVCALTKETDSRFNTYVNINNFLMSDQDVTGSIINRFFVYKNTYLTNDINATHLLYLFVTPVIPVSFENLIAQLPVGLTGNYPFFMQSYTQNSNGSITGIPTLDTSILENTPFESRKFNGLTLTSNYSAYPKSFSLDGTYQNYLVGNNKSVLTSLLNTTVTSTSPLAGINGVPQDLIDGFMAKDYRFSSKYFNITTDVNKKLYILPFVYFIKNGVYYVYFARSLLDYIHVDVNSSNSVAANWPIAISRIPHNPSRLSPVFNTSNISGYPYSYNIPGPRVVANGQTSYCPTIDAHPGYIRITIPFDGFYIDNTTYLGASSVQYYTPFGALYPSAVANVVRPPITLDSTNPSFYIKYKNLEYSTLFTRGATGYSILLTSSTPRLRPSIGTFGDVFYSGQVYSDMVIQPLINNYNAANNGRINGLLSAYYINGSFQLPRFYIPRGLVLEGSANAILSSSAENSFFGSNAVLTFNIGPSVKSGRLLFEGVALSNLNYVNGKNRFTLSNNSTAVNKITPVNFDFGSNSELQVSFPLNNLASNVTYNNFQLTYYPYLNNNDGTQNYYETINLTEFTLITPVSNDFSAIMRTNRSSNNPREYVITLSQIGLLNAGTFTGITLGGGFTLGLRFSTDAATQPYIKCISGISNFFSDTGELLVPLTSANSIGTTQGCLVSFKITNLEYGVNYNPSAYLVASDSSYSNYVPNTLIPFSIPSPPNVTISTATVNNFVGSLQVQNFNVYDTLVQTDFSLPNKTGGSLRLVNSTIFGPNIDYGSVNFESGITYPRTLTVPINKNLLPNTSYNLYPAYSSLPYEPKGWNQYRFTDTSGDRKLSTSAGSTGINYLKTSILPSTGLTAGAISTLNSILGPNAVIYGSSVLYAYLGTEDMSSTSYTAGQWQPLNSSRIHDIDIMVNDQTVFNNIVNFLGVALQPTIYDPFNLYTDTTLTGILNTFVPDPQNMNPMFARKQPVLSNSYPPGGTAAIGPLYIDRTGPTGSSMRYFDQNYKVLTIYTNAANFPIQLHYVPPSLIPSNFTLAEYAHYTSDFTVNAGTYDGVNMIIPYYQDVLDRVAVYKENISVKRRWRMIDRLDKYLQRGFTVFFQSQQQINDWNSLPSGSEIDPWWTDASSSNPKPANTCPFRVLNQMSVLPITSSLRTPFKTNVESLVNTNITNTPQPVLGGAVTVNGFDYTKYGVYSVPSNLGGTLSVLSSSTVLGSVGLTPGVYPQNVTIPLNNSIVPKGSTLMNLVFLYDDPTITGTSTISFTYTGLDNNLTTLNVSPSFYNLNLNIPDGTTIGGSNISNTQPLLKIDYNGPTLTYRGEYSQTELYIPNNLVTKDRILYRLVDNDRGDPLFGNGWEDTTARYLNYLGEWTSLLNPNIGDTVTYGGTLWKCTGSVTTAPGSIDINTGLQNNWTTQLHRNSVTASYSAGYQIVLPNCIPNTEYNISLSYFNGRFSNPQLINVVKTLYDKLSANVLPLGSTGYYITNLQIQGATGLLTNQVVTSGGSTFIVGSGVTVSNFIFGSPTMRYVVNGNLSYPYTLEFNNFNFTATSGITNISYNSVDISLTDIQSSYPLHTYDSMLFVNTTTSQIIKSVKNNGLTLSTINLTLDNLNENTYYNLAAYYTFNGNTQLQSPVYIPEFTTLSQLSFTTTKIATTTDFFAYMSNFVYKNTILSGVFPAGSTASYISIDVYNQFTPTRLYSAIGGISGGTASFHITQANLGSVLPSSLANYNLTYNFINDKGVAEVYTKNQLRM
jgi:hypothetical protein